MSEIWSGGSMLGFCDVRRKLPIHKQSLTQLGRGRLEAKATVVSGSDATIYFATIGTHSTTLLELDSDYTAIVVPIRWRGELILNGEQVRPSNIYLPREKTLFQAHGKERTILGISMLRRDMIATLAALQGVAPDEVQLDGGAVELSPSDMTRGRRSLTKLVDQCIDSASHEPLPECSAEQMTRRITQLLISLYLPARPTKTPAVRAAARLTTIVRSAEERFAAAQAGPVSLADLCVAAGVSQVTLCHAFMVVCGSSPMAYFKKRRLTDARLALLRGKPETDLVKRAALEAGITHMGRFSAEYHQLFGELPATTLNQA